MKRVGWIALLAACLIGAGAAPAAGDEAPLLLAHCMPWYQSRAVSGRWGWHWTMDHYDPEQRKWEGERLIASHQYPLIGPYDSGDDAALECQVLLMKLAGLDGAIIDWYGTRDHLDYAVNHRHTEKLVDWLKRAGLKFAVCYEDQAIGRLIQDGVVRADDALVQARADLGWAAEHWFRDPLYLKPEGRPWLLVFGPQQLRKPQWAELRAALSPAPFVFALPHLSQEGGADGAFAWPPVTGGKTIAPEAWQAELGRFYARKEPRLAVAFPGFKDIYRQAGVHDSYGSIADRDGRTFDESLALALKSGARAVQIATWNDYGEGTGIEPTRGNGFRFLERLQQVRPAARGLRASDLRLPVRLYQLRQRSAGDAALTAKLQPVSAALFEGKCDEAERLLDEVRDTLGTRPARFADEAGPGDPDYRLVTDLAYREGAAVTDAMKARCRLDVYHPATGGKFPTVVWFHGGGLTKGGRSVPLPLRGQKVAVVAVDYRLAPSAKSPAFIEDAAAAVAWTLRHIAEFGGSPDQVFVSGHSAGAYLSCMVGLDPRWLAAQGTDPGRIAGLIPLSPQAITHFAIRDERGIDEKQPVVDDLAPLFHVRRDAPPILLVTGDREKELLGRYEENAYFWRMLKLAGHKDVALHEMKGFDHGGMPVPAFPLLLRFIEEHAGAAKKSAAKP